MKNFTYRFICATSNSHRHVQLGLPTACLILAILLLHPPALANADDSVSESLSVSFDATIASDYVFRGVSQTMSRPAFQLGMDIGHSSGLYGYIWASNIDFVDSADPDDDARWELNFTIGYTAEISKALSVDVNWVYSEYPGTIPDVDYGYDEWIANLYVHEVFRFTAGYSDNVFGESAAAPYYEIGAQFDLPWGLYLSLEGGHYDLDRAYQESYKYGSLTIGRASEMFGWELAYHRTDSSAENIFYASTVEPRLVASLHFGF